MRIRGLHGNEPCSGREFRFRCARLRTSGLGAGAEVTIPAYTWIASAEAVIAVGAVPILAESDQSLTLDPADVKSKIIGRTKAILQVHMRGAPYQVRIKRFSRFNFPFRRNVSGHFDLFRP